MTDFASVWESCRERGTRAVTVRLPDASASPRRLHAAMRYACLNGGKRFRAMLVYLCGDLAGAARAELDVAAAAVEMIHAYSLIHDDLPAMDDDDTRRGQPSCHIKYDEATAILAGDALQSLAFEILCNDVSLTVSAARKLTMVATLADAIGHRGMVGGQARDMDAQMETVTELQRTHELKTGALICAAAKLGGLTAPNADDELLTRLNDYAANVGLAFQIADDVLDAGETKNATEQKITYVSLLGTDKAAACARKLCDNALAVVDDLPSPDGSEHKKQLRHLAQFAINRDF